LDKVDRNLESIKGQFTRTENANLGLYKQIQRLEHELKEVTEKKELQMEVEELQADLPLNNVDLEAPIEEMRILTQKVERVNFYYHRLAEFETLQMEHTFAKAKLLMHQS